MGRCRFHAGVLLLLAAAGLLALGGWWALPAQRGPAHTGIGVGGASLWVAWSAWAAWSWWRSPRGWLLWERGALAPEPADEGGGWCWRWRDAADLQGTRVLALHGAELMIDLQDWALLRLRGDAARVRWIWVERRQDPLRWRDLRRALFHAARP